MKSRAEWTGGFLGIPVEVLANFHLYLADTQGGSNPLGSDPIRFGKPWHSFKSCVRLVGRSKVPRLSAEALRADGAFTLDRLPACPSYSSCVDLLNLRVDNLTLNVWSQGVFRQLTGKACSSE